MAIPTQNLTIRESIGTTTAYVVSFPGAGTFSTPIIPNKLLIASSVIVIMCCSFAFATSIGSLPCLAYCFFWESHNKFLSFLFCTTKGAKVYRRRAVLCMSNIEPKILFRSFRILSKNLPICFSSSFAEYGCFIISPQRTQRI